MQLLSAHLPTCFITHIIDRQCCGYSALVSRELIVVREILVLANPYFLLYSAPLACEASMSGLFDTS